MEIGAPTFYKVSRKKRLKVYEVPFTELEALVRIGFGHDPELLSKFQELDTDFETTVKRNISRIHEYLTLSTLSLYELRYGGVVIGFTAMDHTQNILFSFGIAREYRKPAILSNWMDDVKEKFENLFVCVLFNKNSRAIEFLLKNGMKITSINETMTHLIFNKYKL